MPDAITERTAELESGLDELEKKSTDLPRGETAKDLGVTPPSQLPDNQVTAPPVSLSDPGLDTQAKGGSVDITSPASGAEQANLPKTPTAPSHQWEGIADSDSFKNFSPEQKESVLSNYVNESRGYLHSLVGANPDALDKQLNDFHTEQLAKIMDVHPSWGHQLITNLFYRGEESLRQQKDESDDDYQKRMLALPSEGERSPGAVPIAKGLDALVSKVAGAFGDKEVEQDHTLQDLVEQGTREPNANEISFMHAGIPRPFGQQKGTLAQIAAGIGNLPVDFANFALAPGATASKGLTILEEAPALVQRAVALGFTGDQVRQAFHSGLTLQDRVGLLLGAGLGAVGVVKGPEIAKTLREPAAKLAEAAGTFADDIKQAQGFKNAGMPMSTEAKTVEANTDFSAVINESKQAFQDFQNEFKKELPEPIAKAVNGEKPSTNGETLPVSASDADKTAWRQDKGVYNFEDLSPEAKEKALKNFPDLEEIPENKREAELSGYSFSESGEKAPGVVQRQGDNLIFKSTEEQKGGEQDNGRSNTRQSEDRGLSAVSESTEGRSSDERGTPIGRTDEGRQLEERSTSGARDQTPVAGIRQGTESRSGLKEREQVSESSGGGETTPALSKWHLKYEAEKAKSVAKTKETNGENPNPDKNRDTVSGNTVEEVAHNSRRDLDKQISLPKGASTIRVIDAKGRKTLLTERDLKGANPLHEAGPFKSIEAGTMGKGGKFEPMKEPVGLKERLNAPPVAEKELTSTDEAHQRATTDTLRETMQERGYKAPDDLEDKVAANYAHFETALDTQPTNTEARTKMFDRLRDDLLDNVEKTGSPFQTRTKTGEVVNYNAPLRAQTKLQDFLDLHENAKRGDTPFHGTEEEPGVEDTTAAETKTAEAPSPKLYDEVRKIHARALSAFTKWSGVPLDAAPNATRTQILKAAGLAFDDIFEKQSGQRLQLEKFAGRGRPGPIEALRNDPNFIEAVRNRVLGHVRQDVRALIGKERLEAPVNDAIAQSRGAATQTEAGEPRYSTGDTRQDVSNFIEDTFGSKVPLVEEKGVEHFARSVQKGKPVFEINPEGAERAIQKRVEQGYTRKEAIAEHIWHEARHVGDDTPFDESIRQGEELLKSNRGDLEKMAERYLRDSIKGFTPEMKQQAIGKFLGDGLERPARDIALWRATSELRAERVGMLQDGKSFEEFHKDAPTSFFQSVVRTFLNRLSKLGAILVRRFPETFEKSVDRTLSNLRDLVSQEPKSIPDFEENAPSLFAPGDAMRREDAQRQSSFLTEFAKEHGFDSANELALHDPDLFNEAAAQYRNPTEPIGLTAVLAELQQRNARLTGPPGEAQQSPLEKAATRLASITTDPAQLKQLIDQVKSGDLRADVKRKVSDIFTKALADVSDREPFQAVDRQPTSIKNEVTDRERADRGLPSAIRPARKEFGESWDGAMKQIDTDAKWPEDLVKEINEKARPLTDEENAGLLHRQIGLQNEYDKVSKQLFEGTDLSDADRTELETRLTGLSDELLDTYNAARAAGTENGRGLNSRKQLRNEDYSLATMTLKKRVANGGRQLTTGELAALAAHQKEIAKAAQDLTGHMETRDQANAETQADEAIKSIKTETKKTKETESTTDIREKVTKKMRDVMAEKDAKPQDLRSYIQRLAQTFVRDGVTERESLIDKVHDIVGDIVPEMTRRETMDAISGYGDYKTLSRDKTKVVLRDLKGQMQQIAKIEDFAKEKVWGGEGSRKSGVEQRTPSEAETELIKRVNQLKRTSDFEARSPEEIKTALQQQKERTQRRIDELERRLTQKDFTPGAKALPLVLDHEAVTLQGKYNRLKNAFDREVMKDRLAKRGGVEKSLDFLAKWGRAAKLTAITTLGKITSASGQRFLNIGLEDAVGNGLGRLPGLKDIFKAAPTEGAGGGSAAWGRSIAKALTQGMKDAYDTVVKKDSELTAAFGKKTNLPEEAIDFFGTLHAALKAPLKRGAFEYALEKQAAWAVRNDIDASNPAVQTEMMMRAYRYADRQIFMQDNRVVNAYKATLQALQRPDKTTGKPTVGGKLLSTGLKTELPIIKVPTNYVAEAFLHTPLGLLSGGSRAVRALLHDGAKSLNPEEADLIARHLKKGAIGSAVMLLGFFNPVPNVIQAGGYYVPNERRNSGAPKAGGLRVFGHDIPVWLSHTPLLEALQIGSTMHNVVQGLNGGKKESAPYAAWASTMGLLDETPFLKTMFDLHNLKESPGKYLGQQAQGILVPGAIRNVATWTDLRNGKMVERKPKTFGQEIEQAVPGLRQKVPEKNR